MTFPVYPEYKNSGIDWLQEVPKSWDIKPLKYLLTLNPRKSGFDGDKQQVCSFVPMEKLKTGEVILDEQRLIDEVIGGYTFFQNGDVLQAKVTPCFENKNVALAEGLVNGVGFGSSEINVLRPSNQVDPKYLFYRVQEDAYMDVCTASMIGAGGLRRVPSEVINNFAVAVPPIEDQLQVARFLDHEIAKIDALIREQERLIELLQEKRQAVISHAVTKGLDPDVPMKDSGVEWLGEVPAHWQRSTIKRIATIRYGIGEPPRYQDSGTPLIRATNVDHGTLTPKGMVFVDPKDIPQKRIVWLKRDDILVVRSGAYTGDSAIVTEEYLPAIAGFDMVLRDISCNPMFLQLALLSSYMKDNQIDLEKMRAAQPHLNAEELGSCFLFLPPSEEQGEIVDRINNKTANLDALIEQATSTVGLLKERSSALISAAVTGKIDVRNWRPPADESAFDEEVRQAGMEATA